MTVKSIASLSLRLSGLYEAELLVELMLRYWKHPLADDADFRSDLLENAAEALRMAVDGQSLIADVPAKKTNLVAAVWYVEWASLDAEGSGGLAGTPLSNQRREWLETVRRAVPSCFCSPDLLP